MVNLDGTSANEENTMKPWQMIKILMDRDLRHAMKEFKLELEKSGIQLGPEQLAPLMTVLGLEKKKMRGESKKTLPICLTSAFRV